MARILDAKQIVQKPNYHIHLEISEAEYVKLLREFDKHHALSNKPMPTTTANLLRQLFDAITATYSK